MNTEPLKTLCGVYLVMFIYGLILGWIYKDGKGGSMKAFMLGVLAGAVLTSAYSLAEEDWSDFVLTPSRPALIAPAPLYPPSMQSLPPMPAPHWQHVQPPC